MTLEANIQATLLPCATNGAFQDIAPQNTAAPYIVWSQVVSTTNNTLHGASNLQNTRIQVDVYSKSQAERSSIAAAVVAAMAAASFTNIQISSQNLYEPDPKLFRAMLDFSCWST